MALKDLAIGAFCRREVVVAHGDIAHHALPQGVVGRHFGCFQQGFLRLFEFPHFLAHAGNEVVRSQILGEVLDD